MTADEKAVEIPEVWLHLPQIPIEDFLLGPEWDWALRRDDAGRLRLEITPASSNENVVKR